MFLPELFCKWLDWADRLVEFLAQQFGRQELCMVPPKLGMQFRMVPLQWYHHSIMVLPKVFYLVCSQYISGMFNVPWPCKKNSLQLNCMALIPNIIVLLVLQAFLSNYEKIPRPAWQIYHCIVLLLAIQEPVSFNNNKNENHFQPATSLQYWLKHSVGKGPSVC